MERRQMPSNNKKGQPRTRRPPNPRASFTKKTSTIKYKLDQMSCMKGSPACDSNVNLPCFRKRFRNAPVLRSRTTMARPFSILPGALIALVSHFDPRGSPNIQSSQIVPNVDDCT